MLDWRTGIREGLLDLRPKPGVVGVRIDRETGGKRPLLCDAGQKDANSIRDRQPDTREPFRRFGLERSSTRTWSIEVREVMEGGPYLELSMYLN
jgi:hypothetical protein